MPALRPGWLRERHQERLRQQPRRQCRALFARRRPWRTGLVALRFHAVRLRLQAPLFFAAVGQSNCDIARRAVRERLERRPLRPVPQVLPSTARHPRFRQSLSSPLRRLESRRCAPPDSGRPRFSTRPKRRGRWHTRAHRHNGGPRPYRPTHRLAPHADLVGARRDVRSVPRSPPETHT